jgi:hypothetical protein
MIRGFGAIVLAALVSSPALGQAPQPLGSPGSAAAGTTAGPALAQRPQTAQAAPTAAQLGFPVYPAAQFLSSYDAGGFGQRYYLFATTAPFNDVVTYYRALLGTRGNLVFREPPTHMFEVGRFREDAMVFPPGVTVKDWTWESQGYPNPEPGGQPARFPTVIMIVPPPPQ